MPKSQQDTEITLGTGRMLALFFALVVICSGFFAIGFSLGRKSTSLSGNVLAAQGGAPSAVVRPAAGKNSTPTPQPASGDFSFYKSVEQKNADTKLATAEQQQSSPGQDASKQSGDDGSQASANAYYVQVAAVTRQEDADALVEALKKKLYPAFSNTSSADKFIRVQVGPFVDVKDAELTRGKLIADGYNPILKK